MQFSKRNPLLNNEDIEAVVGSIVEEMSSQDLEMIEGGGIKEDVQRTVATVVASQKFRCGIYYTLSAECNGGRRCDNYKK